MDEEHGVAGERAAAGGCSSPKPAGQHHDYQSTARQLRARGLPCGPPASPPCASSSSKSPAPVIADAFGFRYTTTTRQHVNAGAP